METMHICDWCSEPLREQEFNLRAYRYAELKVAVQIWYRLCSGCYEQIRAAVQQTRTTIRQQKLQALWDHYRQALQPAVEK